MGVGWDFAVDRVRPGYGHLRGAPVGLWWYIEFAEPVFVSGGSDV